MKFDFLPFDVKELEIMNRMENVQCLEFVQSINPDGYLIRFRPDIFYFLELDKVTEFVLGVELLFKRMDEQEKKELEEEARNIGRNFK